MQRKESSLISFILISTLFVGLFLGGGMWKTAVSDVPFAFAASETVVLYDAAVGNNEKPADQLFTYLTDPVFGASATQMFVNGATTLDTTAVQSDKAGYFAWRDQVPEIPVLDRSNGVRLDFVLQVESEAHAGSDKNSDGIDDRAGVSVILLDSSSQGIELAFWEDEIWAQEDGVSEPPTGDLFTHAEGSAFDTTAGMVNYSIFLFPTTYYLMENNKLIHSGLIRDYTAKGGFPYTTPNFVFIGDDTSSAKGRFRLSYAAVSIGFDSLTGTPTATDTAVPTNTPTPTATATAAGTSTPTATATATPTAIDSPNLNEKVHLPLVIKP